MRPSRFFVILLCVLLSLPLLAADLKVRILDPQSRAIRGARVVLYPGDSNTPARVGESPADGNISFDGLESGSYRIEVLAPGFARALERTNVGGEASVSVKLTVASASETVVVSAARTPLPSSEAVFQTESLSAEQIQAVNPVSAADIMRLLPGVTFAEGGRRGSLGSVFARGGDSRYNKVILDGVTINDPGGTFDFGVIPTQEVDRLEFVRGAESALYGSDAMTSVIQMWSANGKSRTPEVKFGADGGNYGTAHGYASISGARGPFDFNFFGDQFNTTGQGINDDYSNSSQGGNLGIMLGRKIFFRLRARHSNNRSGIQSFWKFNGNALVPPDTDQYARQNNFLASGELSMNAPSRWQHRLTGFEYHHERLNVDAFMDPGRVSPSLIDPLFNPTGNFDFPFNNFADFNRAGFEYQGEVVERNWARTTYGYRFEVENGLVGDQTAPPLFRALRRNHELYGQEALTLRRLSVIAGVRYVHLEGFGDKAIPRVSASFVARKGGDFLSTTRLRFSYSTGIKEPRLEETFGLGGFGLIPNPTLKPEQNRSFETGVEQAFQSGKYSLSATYFNNLFSNQVAFNFDPSTFVSEYINLNEALAHGAEFELRARPFNNISISAGYSYLSSQVLKAPNAFDPLTQAGAPLLRRPKHSANILVTYLRPRWGGNLSLTAMTRRPDSDFLGLLPPVTYAAGYGRVDLGGWFKANSHVTLYANVENALNRKYDESAGYPALGANVRAGMRFRFGGE